VLRERIKENYPKKTEFVISEILILD